MSKALGTTCLKEAKKRRDKIMIEWNIPFPANYDIKTRKLKEVQLELTDPQTPPLAPEPPPTTEKNGKAEEQRSNLIDIICLMTKIPSRPITTSEIEDRLKKQRAPHPEPPDALVLSKESDDEATYKGSREQEVNGCLLYTSDAADE